MSVTPRQLRVFFALWPDASARAKLERLAAEAALDRHGRAPREGNLHVTVAFIGGVDAERAPDLFGCGERAAGRSSPFTLTLDRVGGTGQGIAWVAPSVVPPPLAELHESLVEELQRVRFVIERRSFRPHVTLARNCARRSHRSPVAPIGWRVERLSLVASTPAPGGSRYADLASWALAGT